MTTAAVRVGFVVLLLIARSFAQGPCAGQHSRALVLGGGGSKGAFEAGAAYHLIVHRGCDFTELSGTSVGALNAAVLAQAKHSLQARDSLASMQRQAEALISMWRSIRSSADVVKGRPLASLRFAVFGLEALKDFAPLRKLLAANVDLERLDSGRELRVGTVSFHDGRYQELVLNGDGRSDPRTSDFLLASAAIPMFAAMPRIAKEGEERLQFGDGGLRHNAPIRSYFVQCAAGVSPAQCRDAGNHGVPPHPPIEQVFVITTNPYAAEAEATPVWDASIFKPGTHQITDGRKVMARALDIVMDSVHHGDLDSLLFANELLKWRGLDAALYEPRRPAFPLESYNYDPARPEASSRAYEIGIIAPTVGDAGLEEVLSFSRERIAKQMYCGCLAADEMMHAQFGLESKSEACRENFHPLGNGAAPDCRSRRVEPVWHAAGESQVHQAASN